jgi:Tol biopolymer transport system component
LNKLEVNPLSSKLLDYFMQRLLRLASVLLLLHFCFAEVKAQNAQETFGKNRVQYKQFKWKYVSSENFDVYYYEERKKIATDALQYLESEFDRITDLIGWSPYLKTKVFLYNSITDLQQSNIGLNHSKFSVSGETEFIKPYVEIAHPGNVEQFKEELIYKFSDLMLNQMMFGGSLRDMFQNAVLSNLPEWFIEGGAQYVAKGWNAEMDDFVRQLVKTKKVNKAVTLTGKEGALVGQSIWNYVVEKYGKSSLSNILNYTRVIRNEEKSVLITLGIPFKQLMADWRQYYMAMEEKVAQNYQAPTDSSKFSQDHRNTVVFTTIKISPDGKNIAYAENDRGRFTVKIQSLENGKETVILHGGNKVFKQDVDYTEPLLGWADNNTLGVIGIKYGQYVFWLYDLNSKIKIPKPLDKFSNIRSFNFSSNGKLAILSADQQGQNDLFLLSTRRDKVRRLTNDIFDDLDPSFIGKTGNVVFSSNRTNDTVVSRTDGFQKSNSNYNLFVLDLDSASNIVHRVTNTLSKDIAPRAFDENNFYYLSDQRGIINLFKFDRTSGIYAQVTNFNASIKSYDINFDTNTLALVMNKKLKEEIFLEKNFNFNRQIFTPPTRRKEIQQAKFVSEKRKKEAASKGISIKQLINSRLKEKTDTIPPPTSNASEITKDTIQKKSIRDLINSKLKPNTDVLKNVPSDSTKAKGTAKEVNTDEYTFEEPKTVKTDTVPTKAVEKTVNTEDYVFSDELTKAKKPTENFLTRYLKAREGSKITGPFPYEPKVSYENLVTNWVFDNLRGFSIRLETQMNDITENFRFLGGVQSATDWKSGDLYGEVQYLPYRIDYSVRFDRKVIFWDKNDNLQKYSWQKVEFGASLPLTVRTRVSIKPFVGYTRYIDRGLETPQNALPVYNPIKQQFYAGAKLELVYDNSLVTGMNIIEGTRGKVNLINYQGLGNSKAGFSQFFIDIRHYQKVYKEIVFAVRGYGGTFFGNSPKKYVLGGMDNWFGSFEGKTNLEGSKNPLAPTGSAFNDNLMFVEFATSLRGFNYATLYGNNVAFANAELRVPLVRALSRGPITSNFFRNLQFTAFYDIGSSWNGPLPLTSNNSVRDREVVQSPFQITIKEYQNPWIYSYGAGLRTIIFGYYLKFDLAWPTENYVLKSPKAYVTLGFDF